MSLFRNLYYALSPSMRFVARRVWYFPIDCWETLTHKREAMVPPRGMIFIGSGDFVKQGQLTVDLLVKYAGLTPSSAVLDIGCGIGRIAVPLTKYLNEKGSYDGFDIVKKGIDWCNEKIAPLHQNFRFMHIDLKNDLYNLKTDSEARNFVFPYKDNSFDCIVLTSVFTHMMPDDVDNYLGQIARVMRPGGKCFVTFFLINDEIQKRMDSGKTNFIFKYSYGDYFLINKDVKEADIAYREEFLQKIYDKYGLKKDATYYGQWANSQDPFYFQDIVVLSKH